MLSLVRLNGVVHVYDGQRRRFVRKSATNVARALGEPNGRRLRDMLGQAEWVRIGKRQGHYVALRRREEAPRKGDEARQRYPWAY